MVDRKEMIVRFEQANGQYKAYGIDVDQLAQSAKAIWPDIAKGIPSIFRPLLEPMLFGLRHGVLQRMLKERGLPAFDQHTKEKEAETIRAFVQCIALDIYSHSFEQDGQQLPWDVSRQEFTSAYEGLVRRAPEYDGNVTNAIAEAGNVVESNSQPATV